MARVESTFFEENDRPAWAGEPIFSDKLLRGGGRLVAADFPFIGSFNVKLNGAALINATTLTVDALPEQVAKNTVLYFGSGLYARVTATAAKGATSISVEALAKAIPDNAVAAGDNNPRRRVPGGTLVGRTFAERAAGTGFGPADTGADEEFFLTAFTVYDAEENNEVDLLLPGFQVKENFLPDWADLASGVKAKIRALYATIVGAE